ncbi:MAG: histidinol-phosphate transaminase [Ekhidna sp.]|nr:histidinol-phosphate transaminase [Ekhidna sp.]MBC6425809.1 histidinol-phosphate transaminase [Ekhidna sp.]
MFDVNKITRPNIKALKPYSSARNEFEGVAEVLLDANENPFGFGLNRYPDASLKELKHAFAAFRGIEQNRLIFGNGSDEIIDLLIRAFCEPGKDRLLTFPPTFSMYGVSASVNDVEEIQVPLTKDFQIDYPNTAPLLSDKSLKLIFVCSPNNPTGNRMNPEVVRKITHSFDGLVIVDEAYIDFSGGSLIREDIPNLFILQTFSKTFGLAGARLGIGIGQPEVVSVLNKIKLPYNINALTQDKAVEMLKRPELIKKQIEVLKDEKAKLKQALTEIREVHKIYPSDANFLLVEFEDAKVTYHILLRKGIVLRDRSSQIKNTLRITIGTPKENARLIQTLKKEAPNETGRIGRCMRTTAETKIYVEVNLDDPAGSVSTTGVAFFDHMLDQIARHGAIGLKVQVEGDLKIDTHHTIEDAALALGAAFNNALKERKGIERYGFLLPMDDSLAQVAIDFGGRPQLEWDAQFSGNHVGDMPTEMVSHFFKSFSDTARCNLNIKVEGDNDHHKIESIFKAFAKALKMAVRRDKNGLLPSTKGVL